MTSFNTSATAQGFGAVLVKALSEHADREALAEGDVRFSYSQLERWSARWAVALAKLGASPDEPVALALPRSAAMVAAMCAVVRTGAVYVPFDPDSPAQRQQQALALLKPRLGICIHAASAPASEGTRWLSVAELDLPLANAPAPGWHVPQEVQAPLYIMFTSGSTGVPKGVVVPARGVLQLLADRRFADMPAHARWLQVTSPAFDISNLEIWGALLHGGLCDVQPAAQSSLDDLASAVVQRGITHVQMSTSLFNALLDEHPGAFDGAQQVMVGGERVSPPHMARLLTRRPGLRLINAYGPTETTIWSLGRQVTLQDTDEPAGVPIGQAVHGTALRIDQPDPGTGVGELWISGDGLAIGYLHNPQQTQERFVQHDGTRWYRTGDLARQRADGLYEYHGRLDRQVKVNGIRIELDEIELALASVPGVGEVAVFQSAQGLGKVLVGLFTAVGEVVPAQAMRQHMAQRIPSGTLPQVLRQVQSMPRTTNGKLDRQAVQRTYEASAGARAAIQLEPAQDADAFARRLRECLGMRGPQSAIECAGLTLSYSELAHRSAVLAGQWRASGLQSGHTVALALPRGTELLVAMVAAVRCAATYAPLDLSSPPQRLAAMLQVLQPHALVAAPDGEHALSLPGPWLQLPAHAQAQPAAPPDTHWAVWPQDQAVCVMFTSGSTGVPKGVLVPPLGLHRLVCQCDYAELAPGQRWAFLSSPAFDASHLEIWGPLLNGGTCVVFQGTPSSLDDVAEFLRSTRINNAWLTAALFNALVDWNPDFLASLSQLLIGGERLSVRHVAAALQAAPGLRLINGYGPTENTTFTLCQTITAACLQQDGGIPIGRPIRGTEVRLDGAGHTGELLAGGSGVALGYVNNHAETERRFVLINGQRWYRTGDQVRLLPDGSYAYLGRIDRQLKIQGHRIELDEVEIALAACPGVGEAVVLVGGSTAEDRHLVALYGGQGAAPPEPKAVQAHLEATLAPAALPRRLLPLNNMPRNAGGKVDRQALAAAHGLSIDGQAAANTQALAGTSTAEPLVQPPAQTQVQGPAQERLQRLWQQYLPGVAAHDAAHFVEAGGTSLLALRLAAAIAREFAKSVSPVELLLQPRFSQHLALIDAAPAARKVAAASAEPQPVAAKLTRSQISLLKHSALFGSQTSMWVHVALRFEQAIDKATWRAAFATLAQRHPMLRVAAQVEGNTVSTRLLPELPQGWWAEGDPLPQWPADLQWPQELLSHINRPLQLDVCGPMRVDHFACQAGGSLVVWTVHHFAIDESSIDHALVELDALLRGQTLQPVVGSPFAMSVLEDAWLDRPGINELAQQLATELRNARLPHARYGHRGRECAHALPQPVQQALLQACQRWGITPFAALLAAYGMAVQECFGTQFKRVLTPFSRRIEPETQEPITYFLDVRYVEAGIRTAEPLAEYLARVQHLLLSAQGPQFQPLEEVAAATAELDAHAAQMVGAFGFTWRLQPQRELVLGGQGARLLRVPQQGARFDIALHASRVGEDVAISVEAFECLFDDGTIERVLQAFTRRLGELCAVPELAAPLAQQTPPGQIAEVPEATRAALERIWRRFAPYTPATLEPETSFIRQGGSSLAAMRMASEIKRLHGVRLATGTFLANPSFRHLLELTVPTRQVQLTPELKRDLALVGNPAAEHVVMLIPGRGGHAVGLLNIANAVHALLGEHVLVAMVDLERMVEHMDQADIGQAVLQRLADLARALGTQRVRLIAGFSLGGLMAMQTAIRLQGEGQPRVTLLDTYAPTRHEDTWLRSLEARLARFVYREPPPHVLHADRPRNAVGAPGRDDLTDQRWRLLDAHVLAQPLAAPHTHVQLIKADHSQVDAAMLWRNRSNGFAPQAYAEFSSYRLPAWHADLLDRAARTVAHLMVVWGGIEPPPGP